MQVQQVLVGVDGSVGAQAALMAAAGFARLAAAELVVLTVWERVPHPVYAPVNAEDSDELTAARERLEATLERAQEALAGLAVRSEVREGHPAQVLLAASAEADLLVLGAHGLGGGGGLPVGGIARDCAGHAACPVVVMPTRVAASLIEAGAKRSGPSTDAAREQ
ncbi:MAG: UspA domain protein [Frankiales bacterium]|nr:UspA domain protein [Frankiales bacterium]